MKHWWKVYLYDLSQQCFFLSLHMFTQQTYFHHADVRHPSGRPSVNSSFYKRLHGPGATFMGRYLFATFPDILALLDYGNKAHEIEIRPSSVRRPSVALIISEVIVWISFKF